MGTIFREIQMIGKLYIFLILFLLGPLFSNEKNSELDTYFNLYNQIFEKFTSIRLESKLGYLFFYFFTLVNKIQLNTLRE